MKNLMETNIYDAYGKTLICGSCTPIMEKEGFLKLSKDYDTVLYLCLENTHINMAITKICGMLSCLKVTKLDFISVNKSPHCIQLHYIKGEVKRVISNVDISNFIIEKGVIYKVSDDVLSLSKNLVKLMEKVG